MSPGARAALAIWGAAILWDMYAPEDQAFSDAVERGLSNKYTEPLVTAAILLTVVHLLRVVSPRWDLYVVSFNRVRRMVERKHHG